MLRKLIHLLSKEKIYLDSTLASKLGVDERMTKQLLHELVRLEYVENILPGFVSGSCKCCTSKCRSGKVPGNRSAVWMLTGKGRQAAVGVTNKGD